MGVERTINHRKDKKFSFSREVKKMGDNTSKTRMSAPNIVFLALSRELKNHHKATRALATVLRTAPLQKVVYPTSSYGEIKKIIELPFSITRSSQEHTTKKKVIVYPVLPTEALLLARKIRREYPLLAHPWIIDTDVTDKENHMDNHEDANMNIGATAMG